MIKINLLNDKLSQEATPGKSKKSFFSRPKVSATGTKIIRGFETKAGGMGQWQESPAIKFLIIIIFPVVLYLYESHHIGNLNQNINRLRSQSQSLDAQISTIKAKSSGAQKKQALIKELDEKIKFIRELSKTRLVEVKALDTLQSIMPDKLWFDVIEYKDRTFTITGKSFTQGDYQDFSDNIEKSNFFENTLTEKGRLVDKNQRTFYDFQLKTSMRQEL